MWKENLYQPVEVLRRRHTKFPIGEHQHSFYEMVYIMQGSGRFYVREEGSCLQQCRYTERSLFLIPPDTVHCFTVESCSEYLFLRFTPRYAADYLGNRVGQALQASAGECAVRLGERDAATADTLFRLIGAESAAPHDCSMRLIQAWLNALLLLVAEHYLEEFGPELPVAETAPDKALYMLQYIQQQIDRPERLTCEALGETFHLAASYVGPYFKRHFGEDLRHYVLRNRMRAVEHLLAESSLTIKEIAARTGYVDPAHLEKLFRRCHAMTPLEFRRLNRPQVQTLRNTPGLPSGTPTPAPAQPSAESSGQPRKAARQKAARKN